MASIKVGPNGEITEDTQIQFTLEERVYQMRSEIERLRKARDECERQFQAKVNIILEMQDEIERLREALRKIACDDDTCECRAFGSPDAMCELGLARSALEGKE